MEKLNSVTWLTNVKIYFAIYSDSQEAFFHFYYGKLNYKEIFKIGIYKYKY